MDTTPSQQVTPVHGRWYDDACGTAFALELVGERWSLLIVRELMFGPRRFSELRAGLPGISAKVLTERLEGLDRANILRRRVLSGRERGTLYELTEWGYAADEAIMALGRWAARSPDHDPRLPLSAASLMLSFRTMYQASRAPRPAFSACIVVGDEPFRLGISRAGIGIVRGEPKEPAFVLNAPSAMPIAALVYGKVPAADLAGEGLSWSGDAALLDRFVALFHLPPKMPCEQNASKAVAPSAPRV